MDTGYTSSVKIPLAIYMNAEWDLTHSRLSSYGFIFRDKISCEFETSFPGDATRGEFRGGSRPLLVTNFCPYFPNPCRSTSLEMIKTAHTVSLSYQWPLPLEISGCTAAFRSHVKTARAFTPEWGDLEDCHFQILDLTRCSMMGQFLCQRGFNSHIIRNETQSRFM